MLNNAYDYLIAKTASIASGYSENLPKDGVSVAYRSLSGVANRTLSGKRTYITYPFNAIVRGGKDSAELITLCDSMVEALDMDQTGVIQCNVLSEPQYAFTDDNNNLHYTFSVEVII